MITIIEWAISFLVTAKLKTNVKKTKIDMISNVFDDESIALFLHILMTFERKTIDVIRPQKYR